MAWICFKVKDSKVGIIYIVYKSKDRVNSFKLGEVKLNRILITICLSLKINSAFAFSLNCSSKGQDLQGKFAIDLTLDKFQNLLLNIKSEGQLSL